MNESSGATLYKGSKAVILQDVPTAKATGFNAAADDYMERGIDLNEELIRNKPATYFFRMNGDAMIEAGIHANDILIVDRSLKAVSGKIIVATLDGELLVRRLQTKAGEAILLPENKSEKAIVIGEQNVYAVWGIVTYVIHTV